MKQLNFYRSIRNPKSAFRNFSIKTAVNHISRDKLIAQPFVSKKYYPTFATPSWESYLLENNTINIK